MSDTKSQELSDSDQENERFTSATEFFNADNSGDWDALGLRGKDGRSVNRYDRNSLFLTFDPLISMRESLINTNKKTSNPNSIPETEPVEQLSPESFTTCSEVPEVESQFQELARQKEQLQLELKETLLKTKLARYQRDNCKKELNEKESTFANLLLLYEGGKKLQQNFEHNKALLIQRKFQLTKVLALREGKLQYIQQSVHSVMEGCRNEQKERLAETENDNMKLKARGRMAEMAASNLESQIGQSVTESQKLRTLCDELIKR